MPLIIISDTGPFVCAADSFEALVADAPDFELYWSGEIDGVAYAEAKRSDVATTLAPGEASRREAERRAVHRAPMPTPPDLGPSPFRSLAIEADAAMKRRTGRED